MAFSQSFQEGHNGVVEEDDDYGKAKADGGGGSLLLYAQGSSYDGENEAGHGEGEAAVHFHHNGSRIRMGCSIGLLGQEQFADGHFIIVFLFLRNIFRCLGIGDFLTVKVHHAVHTVAGEVIDDAVVHNPYAVFPDGLGGIFHPGHFFILEFLDRNIFQFLCSRIVPSCIEQVNDFPVLHIPHHHMVRDTGIEVLLDFRVQHIFIFPIRPGHHIFIECHGTEADEEGKNEYRRCQPKEALAGGAHDDKFAGAGQSGEAHKRAQKDCHGEGVYHDPGQCEDKDFKGGDRGCAVFCYVACNL